MKHFFYGILLLTLLILSVNYVRNYSAETQGKAAYMAQQKNDPGLAVVLYTDAIQSVTGNQALLQILYFNRGNAYYDSTDFYRAVKDYTMAIDLNPNFAEAYYNRSLAHYLAGYHKESIDDFRQARALKHDIAVLFKTVGLGYDSMESSLSDEKPANDPSDAIDPSYLKRIIRITPFY